MKEVGYKPEQAGAIEAAASNGGQILPPVMGITAFAMAGVTGIPYIKICAMALIPALLYFFNTGVYVQLQAVKQNVTLSHERVNYRELAFTAPVIIVPFGLIVLLLGIGNSVMFVAFYAIVSIIVLSMFRKSTRPSLRQIIEGFSEGAYLGAQIAAVTAAVGLMITTFTMSGLGLKLASGVQTLSGGNFHLTLIIVALICILLGMAGISIAAYLIVAMFAAPALMKAGVPFEMAHFFVLFPALFAYITPPVAFLAIIGAKLAGASYWKTAIETIKVAGIGLPVAFHVYIRSGNTAGAGRCGRSHYRAHIGRGSDSGRSVCLCGLLPDQVQHCRTPALVRGRGHALPVFALQDNAALLGRYRSGVPAGRVPGL